jgi:hypothetical protein
LGEEILKRLRLGAEVAHDQARAANDLAGLALAVVLAETGPLAELLRVRDLQQIDVVLLAESADERQVGGLVAVLGEDAQLGRAPSTQSEERY